MRDLLKNLLPLFFVFILIFSGCISKIHGIKWEEYGHGMEKAKEENKTVMLYFYVEHCIGCRMFEENIFANETVIKESRKFVCIKVNGEKELNLLKKYNVHDFPTILFIKADKEIKRIKGYRGGVEEFLEEMRETLR